MPGQRFVDGVVDDLVDKVMEPALTRGSDIHTRALTDRFETLENCDRLGVVGQCGSRLSARSRRATGAARRGCAVESILERRQNRGSRVPVDPRAASSRAGECPPTREISRKPPPRRQP